MNLARSDLGTAPLPRLLSRLVDLGCRRPWAVLAGALLLAGLALVYTSGHVRMTSDASELIAPSVSWRAAERRMDAAFPGNGDAILAVVDGRTAELAEDGAARLTEALARDRRHVRRVTRPDGGAWFAREGLLFASPAEVKATTARMIQAQPLLAPLAADPSLRGVAGAIDTTLIGVAHGQASLARLEPALGRLADALEAQGAGKPPSSRGRRCSAAPARSPRRCGGWCSSAPPSTTARSPPAQRRATRSARRRRRSRSTRRTASGYG